jgi:nucleoside-diphosphate-sugar epimerase
MRVLVAGGTGAIGRQLVPLLLERGDEVVVLSRGTRDREWVEAAGAQYVRADALVAGQVNRAVKAAAPDAIVDLLTALPDPIDPRRIDRDMTATNLLRKLGAENLIAAASAAGVSRIVAESVAFVYDPGEGEVNPEGAQLWRRPPRRFAPALEAIRSHERALRRAGGIVLRFGHLYGPGTSYARGGGAADQVLRGKFPIVGGGTGVFSFVHVVDAARAIDAALRVDSGPTLLNVVDDDPAPVSEWLPVYADLLGAKRPSKAPAPVARLFAGSYGVAFLTKIRGASNARAKEALGWEPLYTSWREGFAAELGEHSATVAGLLSPAVTAKAA